MKTSTLPPCSEGTPRCSVAARRSSTGAGSSAPTIRSFRFMTSVPEDFPTPCPKSSTRPGRGGRFELRAIPSDDPAMSPLEIWCNESQERYVLAIAPDRIAGFAALCERERCPWADVGEATSDRTLEVHDGEFDSRPVSMPLSILLGDGPADAPRYGQRAIRARRVRHSGRPDRRRTRTGAAHAGGGGQVVSCHHRRSNRRRTRCARSDGRPMAGAGCRLRGYAQRISTAAPERRWRWENAPLSQSSTRGPLHAWRWPSRSRTLPQPM